MTFELHFGLLLTLELPGSPDCWQQGIWLNLSAEALGICPSLPAESTGDPWPLFSPGILTDSVATVTGLKLPSLTPLQQYGQWKVLGGGSSGLAQELITNLR